MASSLQFSHFRSIPICSTRRLSLRNIYHYNNIPSILKRSVRSRRSVQAHKRQFTTIPSKAPLPDLVFKTDLFNYTRGRFVVDEAHEVSQRCRNFNVNELGRIAADAVCAKSCISVEKYPDGMYNRALLFTMDDGTQVVGKVPNPNAGRPYFTTASEVATMDFMRNELKIPVPKVLAWNSVADKDGVGAEYIIMEKVGGIELEKIWPSLEVKDKFMLVKTIAGFEEAWMSLNFTKFGSLYFTKDLDTRFPENEILYRKDSECVTNKHYSVGPSTGRETADNGRLDVEFDRGPWNDLEQFQASIGHREVTVIKQLSQLPKSPITLCGPGTYQPTKQKKLKALECYLKLYKHILPDPSVATAHLWHSDLHQANIFVNPSKPTEIVGIIDWQSTEIAPLFYHARQPQIIEAPDVFGLDQPHLPSDVEDLDTEAKKAAHDRFFKESLLVAYNTLVHRKNPRLYSVFNFQQSPEYNMLTFPRNIIVDGEASYLLESMKYEATWKTNSRYKELPFPLHFSKEERNEISADVEGATRGMELMQSLKDSLEDLFPEHGIVKPEQYEEALDALRQMKEQIVEEYAKTEEDREMWDRQWPFGT